MGNSSSASNFANPKNIAISVDENRLPYDTLGDEAYNYGVKVQVGGVASQGNYIVYDFGHDQEALYTYLSDKKAIPFLKKVLKEYPDALHVNPITENNYKEFVGSGFDEDFLLNHFLDILDDNGHHVKRFYHSDDRLGEIENGTHEFRKTLLFIPPIVYMMSNNDNKKRIMNKHGRKYLNMLENAHDKKKLKREMIDGGNLFDSFVNGLADLGNGSAGKVLKLGLTGLSKLSGLPLDKANSKIPDDFSSLFPSNLLPSARVKKDYSYVPSNKRKNEPPT